MDNNKNDIIKGICLIHSSFYKLTRNSKQNTNTENNYEYKNRVSINKNNIQNLKVLLSFCVNNIPSQSKPNTLINKITTNQSSMIS